MGKAIITEQELALGCARKERDAQGELYARYAAGLYADKGGFVGYYIT